MTKLVQLKTRMHDEQLKGSDPESTEPDTFRMLERTKTMPLVFATQNPKPAQVVIDEGTQVLLYQDVQI